MKKSARSLLTVAVGFSLLQLSGESPLQGQSSPDTKLTPLKHVFVGGRRFRTTAKEATPGEGECSIEELTEAKRKLIGPEFNLGPGTLKGAEVPMPPNLGEFIKDRQVAVALGKALFWDMQVGSDGVQSCATCHFRAGADPRSKNQLSPGGPRTNKEEDSIFDMNFKARIPTTKAAIAAKFGAGSTQESFELHPPNSQLLESDFPFHKLSDPSDRKSKVLRDVDDVVSSQGILRNFFLGVVEGERSDRGTSHPDPIFNVNGNNVRRVEPRNTPTVINAIFFHRTFWDGRAQEIFNGRNVLGVRDQAATVIKASGDKRLEAVKIRLENASLASLSVGPPLSADEMSFVGDKDIRQKLKQGHEPRSFPEMGKRLVSARPLSSQKVHAADSVLGRFALSKKLADESKQGLDGVYGDYIKAAFHDTWWRSDILVELDEQNQEHFVVEPSLGRKSYPLIQYNFSLFFGLALQSYMATLVSDDAKIDRHFDNLAAGKPGLLDDAEKEGLKVFTSDKARCSDCHNGPEFSGAVFRTLKKGFLVPFDPNDKNPRIKPPFYNWQFPEEVERMTIGSCEIAIYDQGFYNIGVRPFTEDLGIGSVDGSDDHNPLSAAKVLVSRSTIKNQELRNQYVPRLSLFQVPSLASTVSPDENGHGGTIIPVPEVQEGERTSVEGAFKIPSLRNIELTAPYFHNGGQLTLRQVVEFYNRGGDFHDWVSPDGVPQDRFMDLGIGKLELTNAEIESILVFLKTLTDERVVEQRAPFDHPQLFVPNGHTAETVEGQAVLKDNMVEVPAVGADGGPLPAGFLKF